MKKSRKLFCLLIIVSLVLLGKTNTYASWTNFKAKRLYGNSRVSTSIQIAKESYTSARNVVLVGYHGEVDALTGSLFAKSKDAPIIFVSKGQVGNIKKLLSQLQTKNVFILGGKNAFSQELEAEFRDYNPKRLEGKNRFDTAVKLSKEALGSSSHEVFLSLGVDDYADALAIGPISAGRNIPLLLSTRTRLPKESLEAIKSMNVKKVNIIGGPNAISPEIENQLKALQITTNRISGDSRELTAINIAEKFNPNFKNIVVANGWNFADAVAGGYFTAKNNGVLLLSNKDRININTLNLIKEKKTDLFVLGGPNTISDKTIRDIDIYLNTFKVSNERDLRSLLANKQVAGVEITNSINISSPLEVNHPLTIEGNNNTINVTGLAGIEVYGDNVKISNLSVENSTFDNILFRNVSGGELNNVSLKNAGEEGLYVDSSIVTANNIETIANSRAGIAVYHDKASNYKLPSLRINGSHNHKSKPNHTSPAIVILNSKTNPNWVIAKGYSERTSSYGDYWEYRFFSH